MEYRIKVLLTSTLGNPREITTICKSKSELKRRKMMYEERYPAGEIFVEELVGEAETTETEKPAESEEETPTE